MNFGRFRKDNAMDKQLSEMTLIELKALAYDQIQNIEIAQNNLRFINEEIQKRNQSQEEVEPESED